MDYLLVGSFAGLHPMVKCNKQVSGAFFPPIRRQGIILMAVVGVKDNHVLVISSSNYNDYYTSLNL